MKKRIVQSLIYAVLFMGLSLLTEIVLMVVFKLKVPEHNRILAPALLAVAPTLAAWICRYRGLSVVLVLVLSTILFTLLFTAIFGRITGISTGLAGPIFVRSLAGFAAALIAGALASRQERKDQKSEGE